MEKHIERLRDTRCRHRLALDDSLVGLGPSGNVIRLDCQDFLKRVSCTECLKCPNLHLSESLTSELSFTSERLLSDEEKARAKERIFSHRDEFGQWNPKNQRPELWNIYNGMKNPGEHFRVFPISNWTEMDVWQYIYQEGIELPSLYYTHKRKVFFRDGQWLAAEPPVILRRPEEEVVEKEVRCRTIGDITCTGVTLSHAHSIEDIIDEIASSRVTERGGRADDKRSETAMEDRKKAGYF